MQACTGRREDAQIAKGRVAGAARAVSGRPAQRRRLGRVHLCGGPAARGSGRIPVPCNRFRAGRLSSGGIRLRQSPARARGGLPKTSDYASASAFHPSRLMATTGTRAPRFPRASLAPVDGRGAMGSVIGRLGRDGQGGIGRGVRSALWSRLARAAGVRPEAAIAGHPERELTMGISIRGLVSGHPRLGGTRVGGTWRSPARARSDSGSVEESPPPPASRMRGDRRDLASGSSTGLRPRRRSRSGSRRRAATTASAGGWSTRAGGPARWSFRSRRRGARARATMRRPSTASGSG